VGWLLVRVDWILALVGPTRVGRVYVFVRVVQSEEQFLSRRAHTSLNDVYGDGLANCGLMKHVVPLRWGYGCQGTLAHGRYQRRCGWNFFLQVAHLAKI